MDDTDKKSSPDVEISTTPCIQGAGQDNGNLKLNHLSGWRLYLTEFAVLLSTLLINVEVTIVSTSLVSITNDFQGFQKTSWIVTGYLVTYMGFMIFWSKLSDIISRKIALIAAMTIFTVFSGACGGAKAMNELIIFRTFQGVGGAGGYSLTMLMTYEMVPKEKIPLYGTFISITVALSTLLGPLLGGVITERTTWRWIFYFNLPLGVLAIVLFIVALPLEFPHTKDDAPPRSLTIGFRDFRRLDLLGATLLLAGSLLLSTVLLDTSLRESWSAAITIALLVLAIASWALFFVWERIVSIRLTKVEAMFPWHWMSDRPWLGMLLSNFLCGMPFNVIVVFVPQRLQTVSGISPLGAGIRLLPYTFGAAAGAGFSMILSKRKVPVVYILLFNAVLQTVGVILLSTLPTTREWPARAYGYQLLAGVGMGGSFGMLQLATGIIMQGPYLASAAGAITQFRFLGGVVGLAIASNILSSQLNIHLGDLIPSSAVHSIQESVGFLEGLSPQVKAQVLEVFAEAYNLQNRVMIAFTAIQIPAVALIWNRKWTHVG